MTYFIKYAKHSNSFPVSSGFGAPVNVRDEVVEPISLLLLLVLMLPLLDEYPSLPLWATSSTRFTRTPHNI